MNINEVKRPLSTLNKQDNFKTSCEDKKLLKLITEEEIFKIFSITKTRLDRLHRDKKFISPLVKFRRSKANNSKVVYSCEDLKNFLGLPDNFFDDNLTILTLKQSSYFTGLSISTIYHYIALRIIKSYRLNRTVYLLRNDLISLKENIQKKKENKD